MKRRPVADQLEIDHYAGEYHVFLTINPDDPMIRKTFKSRAPFRWLGVIFVYRQANWYERHKKRLTS